MMPLPRPAALGQLRFGGRLGWARGAAGALIGVVLAAAFGLSVPDAYHWPWIVAPIGASAVLVFAVPASPLAQPWSVLGGNMLSALVGLLVGHAIGIPMLAAGLAVALAIAVMTYARCLHPPGGACAIVGVLAASAVDGGWSSVLLPLLLNVLALIGTGWLYNNLTGHAWPHVPVQAPPMPQGTWAGTYEKADLDAVIEEWDEVLDVNVQDLDALFRAVERRVLRRWEDDHR
ncbi:CBS domain-containing membrane protein [Novosphingobium hassiacum]|uniref:CBS domain-containing membrane protein n=1 Tax=Novosphingobium hassiacum TaxID=173676 RepID=A0A7W6EVK7_9SPHN|nr:HPP family protein [Novosphingobium hassiacum]MBB3860030.1 CBS domain-containing membrane protein [Novosphingobium hassiacum]